MSAMLLRCGACLLALLPCVATAQEAAPPPLPATPESVCSAPCLRAGTVIELELAEAVSSLRNQRGDRYALRTVAPLVIDGQVVAPAGLEVEGAVVHANKSRSGGQAGELLLAARRFEVDGRVVGLKGMKLGASGRDRSNEALAASFVIGPFAMFMRGKEIEIPVGTAAHAKVAGDVSFAGPPAPGNDTAVDTALPPPAPLD